MIIIEKFTTEHKIAAFTGGTGGTLTLILHSNSYDDIEELQRKICGVLSTESLPPSAHVVTKK